MAQHTRYWSCSKFANWLRGTPKPSAATSDGWNQWEAESKSAHSFRHWLAEEFLDGVQDFVTWPVRKLYDIKYYINNRWVSRTHSLTAHRKDIRPGQWCDVGNRFLPCLFNELVDFVEIELAWMQIICSEPADQKKYKPPFWSSGWFRWRTWRSAQAGLDNLYWQRTRKMDESYFVKPSDEEYGNPTPQAVRAQEIYDLYMWWTTDYPMRKDPYDASGWTAVCEKIREKNGGRLSIGDSKDPDLEREKNGALALIQKIEDHYRKEDEEMLIRLIKVRDSLWT
jgi:hypothetical protein